MPTYIWQHKDWIGGSMPAFSWHVPVVESGLEQLQVLLHEVLLGSADFQSDSQTQVHIDTLVQTALRSSEIEGEVLNARSVRSSVVNKLGLQTAGFTEQGTAQTDAIAELLIEATTHLDQPIALATLFNWQAKLFVEPGPLTSVNIGSLRAEGPMQVVSGRIDKPVVHFEAPPLTRLESELERFLDWFNGSIKSQTEEEIASDNLNPFIRAAVTHLWFITLHPFDDGNGRVARALTDRALAQAEESAIRFYSHSAAIMAKRSEYYTLLEKTQKGSLDITDWIIWFLQTLIDAVELSRSRFDQVLYKVRFWQRHAQTVLNEREIKVLNRLLDSFGEEFTSGINASKYRSLGEVSKATATRELSGLVRKGCLQKLPGGGRSTRYQLPEIN